MNCFENITFFFAALLLVATPILAKAASFSGIAGSPTISQSEHAQIRMESEKVVLTLCPNELFETDARFVLVNDSDRAATVRMVFPETNYGDVWEINALECNDELQALMRAGTFSFAVNGHTHPQTVRRFRRLSFINAGALPDWSGSCFALADFGVGPVKFYEFEGGKVGGIAEKFTL